MLMERTSMRLGDDIMNTLINIPIGCINKPDSLYVADLTAKEHILLANYIGLTRNIIEANQLFEVFYFNLLSMRNYFVFYINDTVVRTDYCPDYDSDFVAVNSLVINLISSAKTLTEFLREIANIWLGNSENKDDKFNMYVSGIYDSSFNYRFLINLRNFMQHGYLPVSFREGKYSFDVNQILETPHFDINKQLKTDIENFITKLEISGENIACMSLTLTISDFAVRVIDIYKKFLFYIKKCVQTLYNDVKKLIETKPSIVCDYHEDFEGYIIYDKDEHGYHTFNSKDNPNKMMSNYEKRVSAVYKDEKQVYDELHSYFEIYNDVIL